MRDAQPAAPQSPWVALLPIIFLVVTLAAIVAIPILGGRYVTRYQREITDLVEPARTEVTHLQLALALEGTTLDDYLETREAPLLQRYREVHDQEQQAYSRLQRLVSELGPEVQRRLVELRDIDNRRHARAQRLLSSPNVRVAGGDRIQKSFFEDVMVAVAQLDETLNDAGHARRTRIVGAERIQRRISVALGILGLAAITVVLWLAQRLRVAAAQAEQRRRAVQEAIESRAKLMRGVSHDLKNPLNAIDGHAQLIEDEVKGPLTPEQRESMSRIRRAVKAQLTLINDLLELSRAEAGQLAIQRTPTDLSPVVNEAVYQQSAAAEASGHTLSFSRPAASIVSNTDPERVTQILGNLISNAIKYTPPGGRIDVSIAAADGQAPLAGNTAAAIRVVDNGPGIPVDKREAIFSEFTRLDPGAAEGSGLGLSIARRIARLLGGEITYADARGSGSVFTLWLPIESDGQPLGRPDRGAT